MCTCLVESDYLRSKESRLVLQFRPVNSSVQRQMALEPIFWHWPPLRHTSEELPHLETIASGLNTKKHNRNTIGQYFTLMKLVFYE